MQNILIEQYMNDTPFSMRADGFATGRSAVDSCSVLAWSRFRKLFNHSNQME